MAPGRNQLKSLTKHEQQQANALACNMKLNVTFEREIDHVSRHVAAAAIVTKLLLIAAHSHYGDDKSFLHMARLALSVIRADRSQ